MKELEGWDHVLRWLDPEDHAWALDEIEQWGAATDSVDMVLEELAKRSEGDRHRRMEAALHDFWMGDEP